MLAAEETLDKEQLVYTLLIGDELIITLLVWTRRTKSFP